jgi:hypothetical protein
MGMDMGFKMIRSAFVHLQGFIALLKGTIVTIHSSQRILLQKRYAQTGLMTTAMVRQMNLIVLGVRCFTWMLMGTDMVKAVRACAFQDRKVNTLQALVGIAMTLTQR